MLGTVYKRITIMPTSIRTDIRQVYLMQFNQFLELQGLTSVTTGYWIDIDARSYATQKICYFFLPTKANTTEQERMAFLKLKYNSLENAYEAFLKRELDEYIDK